MISDYNTLDYLDSDEAISAFLNGAVQTQDPAFIAHAFALAEQAKGIQHKAVEMSAIEKFVTTLQQFNIYLHPMTSV